MVAILLFVIGILGLVGLQVSMTRELTQTQMRSDAAYLAQEMVGLMWADIAHLSNYAKADADGDCNAAACMRWTDKVAERLPGGQCIIDINALNDGSGANGSDVEITVFWTMPNGDQHRYVTTTTIAESYTE
ncbi:type IV pilus modification PilV family protein [Corticibacter populi]|uniref:type IV pilus modification PilV family protein n=1 Tax=Corticibacter populi TaxID=1550736 RepID=UPI001F5E87D7|nr:pilus assembly protein PilV [Corticibacter populi]